MLNRTNEALIEFWENRIKEIKKTGNCIGHRGSPYFQGQRMTEKDMIAFCERQIEKLNERNTN